MNRLNCFVWNQINLSNDNLLSLLSCFDILSEHESLQNAKFEIEDSNMKLNKHFFEKFIEFCLIKPNTKIIIKIPKEYQTEKVFIEYKKFFDETKH